MILGIASLVVIALAFSSSCAAGAPSPFCDTGNACTIGDTGKKGWVDLRPLCVGESPYNTAGVTTNLNISFQICGVSSMPCVPAGYEVSANTGTAVQFLSSSASPGECAEVDGTLVPCTAPCEILGAGVPAIGWFDTNAPNFGVNLSYPGVPSVQNDPFQCPRDPHTGLPGVRTIRYSILCDKNAEEPEIISAIEEAACAFVVTMRSVRGCPVSA